MTTSALVPYLPYVGAAVGAGGAYSLAKGRTIVGLVLLAMGGAGVYYGLKLRQVTQIKY